MMKNKYGHEECVCVWGGEGGVMMKKKYSQ